MNKKVILPNLRAPKGYNFKIIEQQFNVLVQLRDKNNRKVGEIRMNKRYKTKYQNGGYKYKFLKKVETHSWLHESLRGKGIGTLLYSRAIEWGLKHGYKVRSSGGSSDMAQRVWNGKGIRQHFRIRRIDRKGTGYYSDLWYAYPKLAPKKAATKHNGVKHGQKRRV
jgi:GNAT superfamily N-acetyltransferase